MQEGSDVSGCRAPGFEPQQASHVVVWPIVSPPDAKWKAPYSARFHDGASAPGG
jgi:hypothetical protein